MPDLQKLLDQKGVLIGDGAMGTMLIAAGLPPGRPTESWNLENPAAVTRVHREYVLAGADWILTNSFGGNPIKLQAYGLEGKCESLNWAAARMAREAAGKDVLVFGDIGPTGGLLKPLGPLDPSDVEKAYARQAQALAAGGVDALAIETMSDLGEMRAAIRGCRSTGLPVIASFSYNLTPRGYFTMMGVKPAAAAKTAEEEGAWGCGTNCSLAAEEMAGAVTALAGSTRLPILAEPNAGQPELEGEKTVYRQKPAEMAGGAMKLYQAGARFIGACCGSTPEHIRAIKEAMKEMTVNK